jgi:mannose-6-phosphate isomerase-like protein (cupin superfamily)
MYTNSIPTHDLFTAMLSFEPDGVVRTRERRFTPDSGAGWQAAAFHATTSADVHADHWEMHPEADEAVLCLSGGLRMYLRPSEEDGGEEETTVLRAGMAVIVPRGRWHRLELEEPSDLLSITPRRGTRLEKRAER